MLSFRWGPGADKSFSGNWRTCLWSDGQQGVEIPSKIDMDLQELDLTIND